MTHGTRDAAPVAVVADLTDEDFAALGHFMRRWAARGRTWWHGANVMRPEARDALVMRMEQASRPKRVML